MCSACPGVRRLGPASRRVLCCVVLLQMFVSAGVRVLYTAVPEQKFSLSEVRTHASRPSLATSRGFSVNGIPLAIVPGALPLQGSHPGVAAGF